MGPDPNMPRRIVSRPTFVIPVKTENPVLSARRYCRCCFLDSGLRRNDGQGSRSFTASIKMKTILGADIEVCANTR
jgi:hypothetical protein